MRKRVLVAALAALALALLLSLVLLPTGQQRRSGRVLLFEATVEAHKDPPDDPWADYGHLLTVGTGSPSYYSPYVANQVGITSTAGTLTYRLFRITGAADAANRMVSSVRLTVHASFGSPTTASLVLSADSVTATTPSFKAIVQTPSRSWLEGARYRWIVSIPYYTSASLRISPVLPAVYETTPGWVYTAPLTAACQLSDGTVSSSGLTLTVDRVRINATHVSWSAGIEFGLAWDGKTVVKCWVYTTDSDVISRVNAAPGIDGAFAGRIDVAYVDLGAGVTVYVYDQLVVRLYIVLPATY